LVTWGFGARERGTVKKTFPSKKIRDGKEEPDKKKKKTKKEDRKKKSVRTITVFGTERRDKRHDILKEVSGAVLDKKRAQG